MLTSPLSSLPHQSMGIDCHPQEKKTSFCQTSTTLLGRVSDVYQRMIQDLSQWLYRQGKTLKICSFITASLCGEPLASIQSGIHAHLYNWKEDFAKKGIYDAADEVSMELLKTELKTHTTPQALNPLLLLHGTLSKPSIFYSWSNPLQQAHQDQNIGPVITLQLPDDLEKRMSVVYRTINQIHEIYQTSTCHKQFKIDILGHSLGGYAGHLAQIKPDHIHIHDEEGIERRWHSIHPFDRNDKVGKVVSVAAPTWLCCHNQKDETTKNSLYQDIYPLKVYTEKNVESAYTPDQLAQTQKNHPHLLDIIPIHDAISPCVSPLNDSQTIYVEGKHVGVMHDPKVCQIALDFLVNKTQ
jgi:hypothetical protein